MKKIIMDTNALMAIAPFKLDIFSALEETCDFPYEAYVLEGTIKELQTIKEQQREKFSKAAKLALSLLKFKQIKVIKSAGNVDDSLVKHSQRGDLVLTQDVLLKKKLTRPYLTIRQKRTVVFVI